MESFRMGTFIMLSWYVILLVKTLQLKVLSFKGEMPMPQEMEAYMLYAEKSVT